MSLGTGFQPADCLSAIPRLRPQLQKRWLTARTFAYRQRYRNRYRNRFRNVVFVLRVIFGLKIKPET